MVTVTRHLVLSLSDLGDILGVDAVDGVADVLPGGDEEREGETGHDCDGVVQPEDTAVYLDM